MDTETAIAADDLLGGRLALLASDELSAPQRAVHERLLAGRLRPGAAPCRAVLDDGRLIGPFNALLRVPQIAAAQLEWAQAISAADLPAAAREIAILTVAAQWRADYVLYAHSLAALAAGIDGEVVHTITTGGTPGDLAPAPLLAHRLALALTRDHDVDDELFAEVLAEFGETRAVALVLVIGQYLGTCAVVTCFRVPAPQH